MKKMPELGDAAIGVRAWCRTICQTESDVPGYVLLRCPALKGLPFNRTRCINVRLEEARRIPYVAAKGTAIRWLIDREASRR